MDLASPHLKAAATRSHPSSSSKGSTSSFRCHHLWSAILGGVIFHAARNGRLRPTLAILFAYIGVSLLHAAFDSFGGIVGYVVISIIGIAPLIYLWVRSDRGLPFRRQTKAPAAQRIQQA